MIGADEFNVRKSHSASQLTGDIDDAKYIETFVVNGEKKPGRKGLLIDIVRPQPRGRIDASKQSQAPHISARRK